VGVGRRAVESLERLAAALDREHWKGRRVLVTGHTGFKGAWAALLLQHLGARVSGIALAPDTTPSLYQLLSPWDGLESSLVDVRDRDKLTQAVARAAPEFVIHMAAQPLVRQSYRDPVETIDVNVMGTVYLLEALRPLSTVKAIVVVTSDKVYENDQSGAVLSEDSRLGGHDPYSASKAATEIVCAAYARSFFAERGVALKTARAGNVIGGGDWANDRLIPDLWRAYTHARPTELRNPGAIRPWQHVLDPVCGYLSYLHSADVAPGETPDALNFGPPPEPTRTVLQLAEQFATQWGGPPFWILGRSDAHMKERQWLSISATAAQRTLGWRAILDVDLAIGWTAEWYQAFRDGEDVRKVCQRQVELYLDLVREAR
jgi:CDP-glucose 4,6-dehydratase